MTRRGHVMADADVLVDFLAGAGAHAAVADLVRERRLSVSAVAAFEVWCGARTRADQAAVRALLRLARIVPFDATTAARAGDVYRAAEAARARIAHRDAMIAAAAMAARTPLLTRNRAHFARVLGLTLA